MYVWSVRTGKLLDALAGHEGPVSSIAFSPIEVRKVQASTGSLIVELCELLLAFEVVMPMQLMLLLLPLMIQRSIWSRSQDPVADV